MIYSYLSRTAIFFLCLILTTGLLAQHKAGVKGNGNVTTEARNVGTFHSLDISGIFDVVLTQGEGATLKVEADENLHKFIEIDKQNQTLVVSLQKGINLKKWEKMTLHISVKDLKAIELGGMVSLITDGKVQGDEIQLTHSGMGSTDLNIMANKLEADISGMAKLRIEGKVNQVFLENAGMGSIEAEELEATRLTINNSGMGSADVYATTELAINSSGMGKVMYSGKAEVVSLSSSGMAKVKKK